MSPKSRRCNLNERMAFLKQVPLFTRLSEPDLRRIAEDFRERIYHKGDIIFHQDDHSRSLFIVKTGLVRIYHPSFNGEETTVNLLATRGLIGEFALIDDLPRSATAEAKRKCILFEIHWDLLTAHMENIPGLALSMCKQVVKKARWTTFYAETIAQLDVRGRLLCLILHFNEEYGQELVPGKQYELDLGLNQSDLASLVSANRGWVNAILQEWRKQNFLEFNRGQITILNLPQAQNALDDMIAG